MLIKQPDYLKFVCKIWDKLVFKKKASNSICEKWNQNQKLCVNIILRLRTVFVIQGVAIGKDIAYLMKITSPLLPKFFPQFQVLVPTSSSSTLYKWHTHAGGPWTLDFTEPPLIKKGGDHMSMLMCFPIKLTSDWGHEGQVARGWSPWQ